jgi:dihydroxyacetone kinase-like protein
MTITAIDRQGLSQMLSFVADEIVSREADLNALDAAVGDGDHGITMRLGFEAIRERLRELDPGGAIGVVMGKLLMAGGKALDGVQEIRAREFVLLLAAMETSVVGTGKVKPGDRTILDAIHAASCAAKESGEALDAVVDRAASAADAAARNTANMLCRVGRASRLGDRVLGHPDPGATSFAIILKAMQDWIARL